MDKQESTKTDPIGAETTINTITSRTNVVTRPIRRVLQNFLLVWLDTNLDETKEAFKTSFQQLRHIVASIITFTDAHECIDFLSGITEEKVFLIISRVLGRQVLPVIEKWPQLESVYVFSSDQSVNEQWANKISKIKGIYTKIEPICEALQIDRKNCDRAMIPISVDGVDPLFMYTQLLKEALLEIEDDDTKSIKELVDYCCLQDGITEDQIDKIEREYRNYAPIWGYTAPYFIFSLLNRALRLMDVEIIIKMGFFIRHLHQNINSLYDEQKEQTRTSPFQVYHGQGLSMEDFLKIRQNKGGLMSFNNFLSTSRNHAVSLEIFARPTAIYNPNLVGILFIMTIDPIFCTNSSIPFADVSKVGSFGEAEAEILFTTHTVFRIDEIEQIDDDETDKLWQISLTLQDNDNHELNNLTSHLREELTRTTGWSRFGHILIRLGEPGKAEHLYKTLLENASSDEDRASYNLQLGTVYANMGEYTKALSYYERALEIAKIFLPLNHPDLAASYNNIGMAYYKMGECSKALSSYEQSLEIKKVALPPNHPDLAIFYNNIGMVYKNMGEYSKALSSYEKAQAILQKSLPPTHSYHVVVNENIDYVKKKL